MNTGGRLHLSTALLTASLTYLPIAESVPPAAVDPAAQAWTATVEHALAIREYETSRNDAGLQAPNRKHGLRTYFTPEGAESAAGCPEPTQP